MRDSFQHTPVMAREVLELLKPEAGMVFVDGTLGGGGHAAALLSRILPGGFLIGLDRDLAAIRAAGARLESFGRQNYRLIHENFRNIKSVLKDAGYGQADGMLLDVGVSSHQLDTGERGFSYNLDAPLDMRMDETQELTAKQWINQADQRELEQVLWDYGEERWGRRIARLIVEERAKRPIETTGELVSMIKRAVPKQAKRENQHPAKRTFQAIRILVNGELDALNQALRDGTDILAPGGRLAVISFQSLEDRQVKDAFKQMEQGCICPRDFPVCRCGRTPQGKAVTRKPVLPAAEEIRNNPRARSAKLRVFEKQSQRQELGKGEI
ncbi:MAG: 16S rRNA (cytosine(1402)-N(4))-methyltransferase RsmH [Peptococcaceae bacterium]|jgi:16S rRNA (cytosine1402-N4)-methyltransferase|nr:16S rRNA (cytosine(1402)-N(4))-methyltransferase RsmH [Peptococcaceae bacterium]